MILYRYVFVIFLICFNLVARAQVAPDFTVTDSWGNTHKLYEDYLNKGKTVVIELFFATCSPCNRIAPFVEALYQDWNAGQGDVQFIELSILATDTDTKVNAYKSNHFTTYPAAGGSGGSVQIVAPYKSGTFGSYTGTPTFVVIAPDKTLDYGVSGSTDQATIDSLNAAIQATGAQKLATNTKEVDNQLHISLLSNIVEDQLIINYIGEPTKLEATIFSLLGQSFNRLKFSVDKFKPIDIRVSTLPAGTWVLQVRDINTNIMASYLFVKK